MPGITLEIPEASLEFYVASLARGVLAAMRSGSIETEVGIWSLGRPIFQQTLQDSSISAELKNVLSVFDELDMLKTLGGDLQGTLDHLLESLEACQRKAASCESTDFRIKALR